MMMMMGMMWKREEEEERNAGIIVINNIIMIIIVIITIIIIIIMRNSIIIMPEIMNSNIINEAREEELRTRGEEAKHEIGIMMMWVGEFRNRIDEEDYADLRCMPAKIRELDILSACPPVSCRIRSSSHAKTTGGPLYSSHTKTTGDALFLPCQDHR